MRQDRLQRYFRDKCRAFYTAFKEVKRINILPNKSEREILELKNWIHRTNMEFDDIIFILREFKKENLQVIVTEKAQVIILLGFFCRNPLTEWKIIYCNEDYINNFPKDELSMEFLKAYLDEDYRKIIDLFKYEYEF